MIDRQARDTYLTGCVAKRSYSTRDEARRAIGRMIQHGRARDPERLHEYHCAHCGYFHVGHARKEVAS